MLHYENKLKKVYLELTEKCNLNCKSCFRHGWTEPPSDMSDGVFRCLADNLDKSVTIVVGGVGEPTVHPKFAQYSAELAGFELELTSNAFYWSNDTLDAIARYYKKVTVSVDGLPETFKQIRGFDFEIVRQKMRRLMELKKNRGSKYPFVYAQLVLSRSNFGEIPQLVPILKRIGFDRLVISNLLPQKEEDKDEIVYALKSEPWVKETKASWYPVGSANQLPIKLPQTELKTDRRCAFVENGATFVNSRGNVTACYRFAHDGVEYVFGRRKQVKAYFYGSLEQNSLAEIWDDPEYASLRMQNYANRFPSCMDCDNVDFCDYISTTDADCLGNYPSCADCLWTRGFVECP